VVGAVVLAVPSLILLPLIAVAIKYEDRGPLLYTTERVGQFNKLITIYKFRTMTGRDKGQEALQTVHENTKVGLFLRKTRLDELPQLFNVLKGDLSFIDSGVDPKTGGVRVRADFANPDGVLLPGQFIRVSFENLLLPPMTVIPEQAVLMTAMGAMVYVVDENNAIQPRPVVLGPVLESGQLIKSGLNEGDRVIFTSLIRLRPGMQVKAIEKGAEAHAYSAPAKTPQAEEDEAPQIEASAAESTAPIED